MKMVLGSYGPKRESMLGWKPGREEKMPHPRDGLATHTLDEEKEKG